LPVTSVWQSFACITFSYCSPDLFGAPKNRDEGFFVEERVCWQWYVQHNRHVSFSFLQAHPNLLVNLEYERMFPFFYPPPPRDQSSPPPPQPSFFPHPIFILALPRNLESKRIFFPFPSRMCHHFIEPPLVCRPAKRPFVAP